MQHRYVYRIVVLSLLGLLYIGLIQKYRAYDIDNPWFLSFSYNYCHGGTLTDEFAGTHYPEGMDGVHLFGKVAARTQCVVLDQVGWTPWGTVGLISIWALIVMVVVVVSATLGLSREMDCSFHPVSWRNGTDGLNDREGTLRYFCFFLFVADIVAGCTGHGTCGSAGGGGCDRNRAHRSRCADTTCAATSDSNEELGAFGGKDWRGGGVDGGDLP